MPYSSGLDEAFDAALNSIRDCRATRMTCLDGSSAEINLNILERELLAERSRAAERGLVDREWFQTTVRWLVEWAPERDLTLIAALGRIVRAKPQ